MQRCMKRLTGKCCAVGVNEKLKLEVKDGNILPAGQQAPLSGRDRIHGQCSHQEVVFDMALVSALICMQVLHEIVADASIRKFLIKSCQLSAIN